jgi:hypothetical protein
MLDFERSYSRLFEILDTPVRVVVQVIEQIDHVATLEMHLFARIRNITQLPAA